MRRLSAMLAVLLVLAVSASASAASPPTGGAAPPPAVGNVNVYFGQLKGAGLNGNNVTATNKVTRAWQPCAVKVCGGYVAIHQSGQKLLVLRAPQRYVLIDGNLGYADNNGVSVNYSWSYDPHKRFSLRRIPLTRTITFGGQSFVVHLTYVEMQAYDPRRPFPQGCNYNGCASSMR